MGRPARNRPWAIGWALRAAASLAAGAVVTVLVAWGCALWSGLDSAGAVELDSGENLPVPPVFRGVVPGERLRPGADNPGGLVWRKEWRERGRGLAADLLEVTEEVPTALKILPDAVFTVFRAGWPLPALAAEQHWTWGRIPGGGGTGPVTRWEHAAEAPGWARPRALNGFLGMTAGERRIPLRPLPAGLAADTALFGLVILGVSLAPGALRRRRRRARGRCPSCGYDLGGLAAGVCPECGG